MINIYQHPTEKNPTVGVTFMFFKTMELGMDYRKYPDLFTAEHNLQQSKISALISNLEALWMFCDRIGVKENQVATESMNAIRASVQYALDNRDKFFKILEEVTEKANFMRTLMKETPEANGWRDSVIMMAASIQRFCKAELDEYKKNQSKEQ